MFSCGFCHRSGMVRPTHWKTTALEKIICSTRGFRKEGARPGAGRPRRAAREAGGGGTGDSLLWLLQEETGAAERTGRELAGLHNLRAAEPRSCPQWAGTWPRGDEDRSSVARSVRQPSKRGAGAWALAGRVCFWEARPPGELATSSRSSLTPGGQSQGPARPRMSEHQDTQNLRRV